MGIAGLVLGILGAIGGWIPGLNYIAWLLALIGIILSAVALKNAKAENQPTGIPVAGLVLSIIGLVIALAGLICLLVCVGAVAGAASSFIGW
jgi:hypothetical protein